MQFAKIFFEILLIVILNFFYVIYYPARRDVNNKNLMDYD
ncbi:hypothetical protein D083_3117 [Dickeya solani RNS 08.23.3.1.A]|nr:hypothetical protein D083_3117 [Dickeya solani RNS 08.23.3.1.A]